MNNIFYRYDEINSPQHSTIYIVTCNYFLIKHLKRNFSIVNFVVFPSILFLYLYGVQSI